MNNHLTPNEMQEKIEAFRQKVFTRKEKKASVPHSVNVMIMILSDLIGGLLVGAGIGYLIHRAFDTHVGVLGIFILLGGLAGFLNVFKSLRHLEGQVNK